MLLRYWEEEEREKILLSLSRYLLESRWETSGCSCCSRFSHLERDGRVFGRRRKRGRARNVWSNTNKPIVALTVCSATHDSSRTIKAPKRGQKNLHFSTVSGKSHTCSGCIDIRVHIGRAKFPTSDSAWPITNKAGPAVENEPDILFNERRLISAIGRLARKSRAAINGNETEFAVETLRGLARTNSGGGKSRFVSRGKTARRDCGTERPGETNRCREEEDGFLRDPSPEKIEGYASCLWSEERMIRPAVSGATRAGL